MEKNKLETISNLFEGKEIRSIWDSEKEDYFFSVVDVIRALTDSKEPSNYWTTLKRRLKSDEGSEIPTKCLELKMKSQKDGKLYKTDTLDTEGIFRIIESVPSPKAEPFKLWLAKLGGGTAKVARDDIEKKLGESIVTKKNTLNYQYVDDKEQVTSK